MDLPTINDVIEANNRIGKIIRQTPVLKSTTINEIFNAEIFLKCENFQKTGSFKFRGATNSVFSLTDEQAQKGVATHSSGNFAQALAKSASIRNIEAHIVMPSNASEAKKNAVLAYGGRIIFCEPTLKARETTLEQVVKETGATFIHPYNNFNVIAGQGTCAYELLNEIEMLDYIICPVGGGGLLSGTLLSSNSLSPATKVIAAEPEGAADAYHSMIENRIVPSVNPKTIADGLLTSLGDLTFPIIKKYIYKIMTVSDESIIKAMKLIWERMKIIVEPSSATTLAVILQNQKFFENSRIGLIISGGNIDLNKLPW